jgi:hypothetical protein
MVINYLHIEGISTVPSEADPPLPVDPNAELTLPSS